MPSPAALGRAAARTTARTQTVKVNKPGGAAAVSEALRSAPSTARQLPRTYGEQRRENSLNTGTLGGTA